LFDPGFRSTDPEPPFFIFSTGGGLCLFRFHGLLFFTEGSNMPEGETATPTNSPVSPLANYWLFTDSGEYVSDNVLENRERERSSDANDSPVVFPINSVYI
jgi:hypothetical protein